MKRLVRLAAAVLALSVCPLFAADDPTYAALRAARPDGRTIALNNHVFEKDVLRFTLTGTLHLLAPVDGKTVGGVFIGQGSYTLTPATATEQRQLAINAGDDKLTALSDTFENAVFFSSELTKGEAAAGAPSQQAIGVFEDYLKKQRKDFDTNIHVRVLQEMWNGPTQPLFLASVDGKKYPPALLAVDPLGVETMRLVGAMLGSEETLMYVFDQQKGGAWYLNHLKSEIDRNSIAYFPPLVDAEHYSVETTIAPNVELKGLTTLTFANGATPVRVLPINLLGKLRIEEVAYSEAEGDGSWKPAAFVQEKAEEDPDAAVIFPAALAPGMKYKLRVSYKGKDVLDNAGDGNFSVGARSSWYPNVGTFSDLATFDLNFRTPQKLQIVAVGDELENKVEGDVRVATWKTTQPLRVAGFNYGKFKKLSRSDKDSGMQVDVYTNPGTPNIIRDINMYLEALREQTAAGEGGYIGPGFVNVDTARLAESAIADGVNTSRVGNHYFGPLPQKRVAITQQSEWNFGQSWPSLIYMPYLAFLDGTTRNTLGLNGMKDFIDNVGAHEFGHQWWGHHVGWRSYHDQWLSEGFAEFTAGLVVQATGGWPKYNDFWEKHRRNILEKPRGATIANDAAGPITQGWRVSTWQNPAAYDAMTYSKGAYVLHMLRMTMQDRAKPNPDEAFTAMMTDFATTYAGKHPSTRDFQKIVEKHATPTLKISSDGKLDWFFNQWVHGTMIPKYTSKLDYTDLGGGKYKVSGTITQSGVDENFAVVMPMYVNFDKTSFARLGAVPIVGNTTKNVEFEVPLPKKPRSFSINNNHDILAR